MSTPFQTYFDRAELALAAYSNFFDFGSDAVADKLSTIPAGKTASDFSATQAAKFVERFDVLDQFTENTFINGFSATVFRDKTNGQIYFVNRGIDDNFADGLLTDAVLALGGKSLDQIISMVNYYLRVQAGTGNASPSYAVGHQTNLVGDYLVSAVPGHCGTDTHIPENDTKWGVAA